MQNENRNDEAVSPVIATILMVAITVVLAGVLYVWAASLADVDGELNLYSFGAEDDTSVSVTDGTDDLLVRLTMNQGDAPLNWANVKVIMSVKGTAPVTCDNPGLTGGACSLVEFGTTGDNFWSPGDGVSIWESGQDLCGLGEICSIEITVIDKREGNTLSMPETDAE